MRVRVCVFGVCVFSIFSSREGAIQAVAAAKAATTDSSSILPLIVYSAQSARPVDFSVSAELCVETNTDWTARQ